jgi:hypothetical protein
MCCFLPVPVFMFEILSQEGQFKHWPQIMRKFILLVLQMSVFLPSELTLKARDLQRRFHQIKQVKSIIISCVLTDCSFFCDLSYEFKTYMPTIFCGKHMKLILYICILSQSESEI